MPMDKEMQHLQEFLAHPGMEIFRALILGPSSPNRKCLEEQLNDKLKASARAGDAIKSAEFAGQIDILPRIFKVAEDVLNDAMSKQ